MAMGSFDNKIDCWKGRIPSSVLNNIVWVSDTIELCHASAKQTFGDKVDPNIALQIYDRLIQKINNDKS
jgi:hypothetical protein